MNESSFRLLLLRFALAPVICVCFLLAALGLQLHRLTIERAQASHATAVILQCDRLLNSLVDQETGVRGYAASGDPVFLEPYKKASAEIGQDLDGLAQLTSSDPVFAAENAAIHADFERFEAINAEIVEIGPTSQKDRAGLLQQKQTMDNLRAHLGQLIAEQSKIRQAGVKKINELFSTLPVVAIAGGAIVVLFLVWDGIAQFRGLVRVFRGQIAEIEVQRNSLRTTLHSIGDAVIVCDEKGAITLMNPTAQQLTGWSGSEAAGKQVEEVFAIFNETTREKVESPVDRVLRSGQIVGLANHTVLVRRDGSEIAIDDSGAPILGEKNSIVGAVLVFRDIQERRKAERELALRTAELESLVRNSPAGFATLDRAYHFLRVNPALAQIDGVAESEHLGRTLAEIVPASSAILQEIVATVFRDGVTIHREFTGQNTIESSPQPSLERQWLTWFYPVRIGDRPEPVLVGAIVVDNSSRWQAQQALIRSEKLVAVGRLTASIAHEMNNPLTSVTNLLYLAVGDPELTGRTREFVERASVELDRVSKIATQTLRFARRTVAPAPVNLEELVKGLALLFAGRLNDCRIEMKLRKRRFSTFIGYSNELMQLITNLITNAIDAIGNSGDIAIGIQDCRNWRTGEPAIALSVADSGTGIDERYRTKIWEPFFTTKAETGTGLGLWLVEEPVRKNNGVIRMKTSTSATHHGTVFRLLLPLDSGLIDPKHT